MQDTFSEVKRVACLSVLQNRNGVRRGLDAGPQAAPRVHTSARFELPQSKREVTV